MDKELINYYQECVRTAETRVKSAKEAVQWWQARVQILEAGLDASKRRLHEAQADSDIWDS